MSRMAGISRTPRVKLTYDDFVRFPDDGMRHELIDGEHYVTPSPNTSHQRVVGQLHGLIWTYLRTRPVGEVFTAPFDVVFSNVDVVEPDLLFVSKERASVLTQANVQGSPDLVVEVRSPSTGRRDETIKLSLYERAGVSEYLAGRSGCAGDSRPPPRRRRLRSSDDPDVDGRRRAHLTAVPGPRDSAVGHLLHRRQCRDASRDGSC